MMTDQISSVTGPVTTRFTPPGGKPFSWSYSKLKNYEICPKRHYEIDIAKTSKDTGGEALIWGNRVHDAMKDRLTSNKAFAPEMIDYEPFAKRILDKVALNNGTLLVEQKYAITRAFKGTGYFAPDVWYRGIADVLLLAGPVALAVDWKTGKVLEDSVQLALMAQCVFSFYPEVLSVATRFAWLKEHAETDEVFTRQDMVRFWPRMLQRVEAMEQSAATMNYPPLQGKMCKKYCPVHHCPFHGK